MVKFNIRLDKNLSVLVKQLKEQLSPVLDKAVMETATWGKGQIVRETAVDTGQTARGWKTVKEKVMQWKIYNIFKHAKFLETGTGLFGPLHKRIYPITAKYLHWEGFNRNTKSGDFFALSTKGMKAQPAISPTVEKIQKDLNIRVRNAIRRLFKSVKGAK